MARTLEGLAIFIGEIRKTLFFISMYSNTCTFNLNLCYMGPVGAEILSLKIWYLTKWYEHYNKVSL